MYPYDISSYASKQMRRWEAEVTVDGLERGRGVAGGKGQTEGLIVDVVRPVQVEVVCRRGSTSVS